MRCLIANYGNQKKNVKSFSATITIELNSGYSDLKVDKQVVLQYLQGFQFPLEEKVLKREIEKFAKYLIAEFKQNRLAIEFLDETLMLEVSEDIDPKIIRHE